MLKKEYSKSKPICKVTFTLPQEAVDGGDVVKVLGEFNNWSWKEGLPMKAGKDGFKASVELATGRHYEFRYMIDGKTWINDWEADAYYPTPYGVENSVVFIESVEIAAKPKKAAPKKAKAAAKAAPKKEKAAPKTPATPDDLKKIEGIGPKIEALLNAKGIYTFADLSNAKKAALTAVLTEAGSRYKMHDPATWAKQAKLAAGGEWDKLTKWQAELKGGKKK
jgi:predicted flap endonuclease-1-like 5' DNA nuclease